MKRAAKESDARKGAKGAHDEPAELPPQAPGVPPMLLVQALRRAGVAGIIFVLVAYVLVVTAADPGLTWDEPIYMRAAVEYWDWFHDAPRLQPRMASETLRRVWLSDGHPPLGKLAIMLPLATLNQQIDPVVAARLMPIACFALVCALLFFYVQRRFGLASGVCAAVLLAAMPRVFAHAHLASLEMPLMLTWVATIFAFEKGIHSRFWSVVTGVCFGLALLTKFNAVLLPVLLFIWGFIFHGGKVVPNLVCMGTIGPIMFFAGWPAMWQEPVANAISYVQFQMSGHRLPIPVYYLGKVYGGKAYADLVAPWHYPFVMTLLTTPLLVLFAAAAGVFRLVWPGAVKAGANADDESAPNMRPVGMLFLFAFLAPLLLVALPGAPKYDGERLFLTAFPFLAALGGIGLGWLWDKSFSQPRPNLLSTLLTAVLVVFGGAMLVGLVALHPFQMSYYSEAVGGPWGAKKLGMEPTYWGDTFNDEVLQQINARLPGGGKVALVCVGEFVWPWLEFSGRIPNNIDEVRTNDIVTTGIADGDWDIAVVIPRWGWVYGMLSPEEQRVVRELQRRGPDWVQYVSPLQKVPVCLIYCRPGAKNVSYPPKRTR